MLDSQGIKITGLPVEIACKQLEENMLKNLVWMATLKQRRSSKMVGTVS